MTRINAHIANMASYAIAELSTPEGVEPISLAQNESAFPPSPLALAAARDALDDAQRYPDPRWTMLRSAIASVHGINAASIMCGMGSMELISALMNCYAGPGSSVLSTDHAYAFFRTAAHVVNAPYVSVPEPCKTVCVDSLLAGVEETTNIVCVANPGNPTGTRIPVSELRRLRDALRENILLVIDEAYGEFCDTPDETTFDLPSAGNTVILRTFSKAYGLAGMRVGWGVFPHVIAGEMRKVLNPSNISVPAQAAAVAAVHDQDHMKQVCAETIQRRDGFIGRLRALEFSIPESHTNFVLIPFADATAAQSADRDLRQGGIVMRGIANYGLSDCLRATIGDKAAMDLAADILKDWMKKEGAS